MNSKQREIIEDLGWTIHECSIGPKSERGWEIGKYSPAGEDFSFSVEDENFVEKVREYAADFDPDEHVGMWVTAKYQHGGEKSDIPSVRELIEDADAINQMLHELAAALSDDSKDKPDRTGKEPATIRIFLWNGVTESIQIQKCAKNTDTSIEIFNCDEDCSDRNQYKKLIRDENYEEANWISNSLEGEEEK